MESPAESVCGSTGEPPTPSSPEKSDPKSHCVHLQRENNKLKRKLAVLKEKAEGTEELLSVYRELRTKHTELQLECDDLRLKTKDEDRLKRKISEAENRAQKELEKRSKLQEQLNEALERCESVQGSRISLMEQMRTEQETMVSLKEENATLKRKLDQLTDEQKRTITNWKEFEHDMTKLMHRTGFGFGHEGGLIKADEIDLKTPEVTSQMCSDLATPSDGHSVDDPTGTQAKSTPPLESSRLSHASSDSRSKSLRRTQFVHPMTGVIKTGLDGSGKCPGGAKLTAKLIMDELKSCAEEDSLLCLVSRTLTALHEKHFPLPDLIRSFCDCFLTCSSSVPVLDTPSNNTLHFLIPWCKAGSTDHTFFSKTVVFILQLDDRMEADLVKCVSNEILDIAMSLMEQKKCLAACSLIAGLGHLCKTKNQNQILSIALVEILSTDKNSTLIPVLCVLLHSCPELLTRTPQFQKSFIFELLIGCVVEIITRILNSKNEDNPVVQFCSQKILSCGFQHHWWSSNPSTHMTHQPLTVKLPTGHTSDQQIEQFLTFCKQLLSSKDGPLMPQKAWFELELGFVIITKHKGYHWIQGITSALIVHWIKDLEQDKLVKLGRVLGPIYTRLLTRWKDCSNQFLGVIGMLIECLNHFEKRVLKPRPFLRELLHSFWKAMNSFFDDGKWRELNVTQWEELKHGIVEVRCRSEQYDVTSTLSDSFSEHLTRSDLM